MDTIGIRLVYFAVCREALRKSNDRVELAPGATVADVIAWLDEHRAPLRRYLPTVRVAVNQEFASSDKPGSALFMKLVDPQETEGERFEVYEDNLKRIPA